MAGTFDVELVTPERVAFSGPARLLTVPGIAGSLGILANHAPLLTELRIGEALLEEPDGERRHFFIGGGFLEVNRNRVTVLAQEALGEDEMELAEAERLHREALQNLDLVPEEDEERAAARLAVERAAVRARVVSRNR